MAMVKDIGYGIYLAVMGTLLFAGIYFMAVFMMSGE